MQTQSVKEFCSIMNFVQIAPEVRTNVNNYPYVTFINKDNVAENIYFSSKAAMHVTKGQPITRQLMLTHQIAVVKNEKGEERTKLISLSDRIDINSLLADYDPETGEIL